MPISNDAHLTQSGVSHVAVWSTYVRISLCSASTFVMRACMNTACWFSSQRRLFSVPRAANANSCCCSQVPLDPCSGSCLGCIGGCFGVSAINGGGADGCLGTNAGGTACPAPTPGPVHRPTSRPTRPGPVTWLAPAKRCVHVQPPQPHC